MKRAVIYARVSKQREESASIEAQIEHCTARATQLGATVVQVFMDDGISGREARNRAAFLRAKAYCEAANVDYFITWSTSRFARNMLELFRSESELRTIGTKLECLNADIDEDTDTGFINKAINGLMDEMYSRQVARDTLRSQKKSAEAGFFTGGRVPFGYRRVADGSRARLEPCPADAPIASRVFQLALQGSGAMAIALVMNSVGLHRRGKPWSKNTVNYMLKSEIYTGVKTFNKTHRRTRTEKPRAEWIQVLSHAGLVARDDFERIQTMLQERTPHHEHGGTPRSAFLFTGMATCGICSGRLQICTGKGRQGVVYSYYGCMAHRRGAPRCLFRQVRADLFDDWMLDQILAHVITEDVMAQAIDELMTAGAAWIREREARRTHLVAAMREQEGRRDKLFELLEAGGKDTPDLGLVAKRLRDRTAELEQLQLELAALEDAPMRGRAPTVQPAIAVEVMREVIASADTKRKRAFLGAFIERITVSVENVTIDYRPEALLDAGSSAGVRSECGWLPVAKLLRTRCVRFELPFPFRRLARSAELTTLAQQGRN